MINITPTSHYSTNFKAKTDYSKIYKEMGKISLQQDEKIIPKISEKKFNVFFNKLGDIKNQLQSKWKKCDLFFDVVCPSMIVGGCCLLAKIGILAFTPPEKYMIDTYKQQLITSSDSLDVLLDKGTISFDEYRKQMKNIIKEHK